jgi:hypothetical protein
MLIHCVCDRDDPGRDFEYQMALLLRCDEFLFNSDRDSPDQPMAAHRETSTGLHEENRSVMLRIYRRINKTTAHHIMSTGLKHQALSNPIILSDKLEPTLTHRLAGQFRPGSLDHTNGISAGMPINAFKYSSHLLVKVSNPCGLEK